MIQLIAPIFILCIANGYEEWVNEFNYHTTVGGSNGKYEIYWNANQDDCILEIGLAVQTDGWVAFGMSESGSGMQGSDIVLGWITPDDQYVLDNRFGQGFFLPQLFPDQSHIKKIEGWKDVVNNITMTYLRFEKEMFPDFDERAVSVKLGTSKVIWAYTDGELYEDAQPTGHQSCPPGSEFCTRGIESMNLLQGESIKIPLEPDATYHDVNVTNFAIPNTDTTYYCYLHELPPFEQAHHIVQIDPLIQSDNIGTVHHIILYVCAENVLNMTHVGSGSICDELDQNMPGVDCRGGIILSGWAIGGNSFYFPEDVGLEMSGPDPDAVQYVLLEMHYDNPDLTDGIIDSSGVRLWYTPTLRPMSAAVLMIGMGAEPNAIFVPPGIENAKAYGYCFMDCLQAGIEGTGDEDDNNGDKIYAFANHLHAHLLSKQLTLKHIRNGKELRPLDMNLAYDFNYQQFTPLPEVVEILPGDELVLECVYDSTVRNFMTWGGESTNEEMCFSFLMVYPKPKMGHCSTSFLGSYNKETGQGTEDLGRFWAEAEQRGYVDQESNAIYDITQDGALEFYTDFQEGNIYTNNENGGLRYQTCLDFQYAPILPGETVNSVLRSDIEYNSFNNDNYYVCGIDEDDKGFDWNGWYVYFVASLIGVILIIGCIYLLKWKNRNKHSSVYDQVLDNEKNNYGTKSNEEVVSMQKQNL